MDAEAIESALRAGDVGALVGWAEQASGLASRRYAIEVVARALMLADPGSVGPDLRQRARALGLEQEARFASEVVAPPHGVRVPLVDRGRGTAFVRMLWVEIDPTGIPVERPALGPEARAAVVEALRQAAEQVPPAQDGERVRLVAARPAAMEGVAIDGASLGAAALVSAVALWSDRAVRPDVAITGAVVGGNIARVGGVRDKAAAAVAAGCRAIIVPASQVDEVDGLEAIGVATVGQLLEVALVAAGAPSLPEGDVDAARAAFRKAWRGYHWPALAEQLTRTAARLPAERPDLAVEVLARLGASRRHLGDPEGSLRVLDAAARMVAADRDGVPDGPLVLLAQQRAMTALKLFQFSDASAAAGRAVAIARRARLRGELAKALGCAGLVALARGRHDEARDAFERALEITLRHAPHETSRGRMYLIEALGRLGDEAGARAHAEAAMLEVERTAVSGRRSKESWVRTGWGGALVALGRPEEAAEVLDVPSVHESLCDEPLPGLLARRHLGVAWTRSGRIDEGLQLLADSPLAHGRTLEASLRARAHAGVLVEAQARLAVRRFDADTGARVRFALAALPTYGAAPRWLGKPTERVLRALGDPGGALPAALEALLQRCEAL